MTHDPTPGPGATTPATARRLFDLVEPIGMVPYATDEPTEAVQALGFTGYWPTYFAARAAPLGASVPAAVVHALFYGFGPGEVARHVPRVWRTCTPEQATRARLAGCAVALRRILGDLAAGPRFDRTLALLLRAATGAPVEGRPMYAALCAQPVPADPVEALFHAATMLREHRGDGHVAVLVGERVSGLEAHALLAVDLGLPVPRFGRLHHLPPDLLADLVDGLVRRGVLADDSTFTPAGRALKDRVEARTDELAAAPYDALTRAELDELVAGLEPLAARLAPVTMR